MAHHTTKAELKRWIEEAEKGVQGDDLIRLARDASKLHDLDEIYEYMKGQPVESTTIEEAMLMLAHCATDCADKDLDIARRDKEIADLRRRVAELEADKPN
jgi:hypothetical protein